RSPGTRPTGGGCRSGRRRAGGGWRSWGSASRCPGRSTRGRRAPRPAGGGGKNLRRRLARLRRPNPGKRVEVWAQDEARLGLKPVEPLWPLVREAVANRTIGRIGRLRSILRGRLAYLARNPAVVRPVVGFHWATRLER